MDRMNYTMLIAALAAAALVSAGCEQKVGNQPNPPTTVINKTEPAPPTTIINKTESSSAPAQPSDQSASSQSSMSGQSASSQSTSDGQNATAKAESKTTTGGTDQTKDKDKQG